MGIVLSLMNWGAKLAPARLSRLDEFVVQQNMLHDA
jgi:hypothetical protein